MARPRPAVASRRRAGGFTLIELAVVVAIVGLLLGGLLVPLTSQIEVNRVRGTESQLADLKEALYGFTLANGWLPCPDTDGDGQENRAAGNCAAAQGEPPWADLGVSRTDAWGRVLIYRVDIEFADQTWGTTPACGDLATAGVSFELCAQGGLQVLDSAGGSAIAANLPAVVLSQGPGGASGFADENENTDGDNVFVSHDVVRASASAFDDLVEWVSPHVLRARMVQASRLP